MSKKAADAYEPLYKGVEQIEPIEGSEADARAMHYYREEVNQDVTVGDLSSPDIGTGARKNADKPDYSLMPPHVYVGSLKMIMHSFSDAEQNSVVPLDIIEALGNFFQGGLVESLELAQALAICYMDPSRPTVDTLEPVVRVWEMGAQKYAAWNWAKGMPYSVPFACAMRHLAAVERGDYLDPDSGLPHIAHAICNIQMLIHYVNHLPEELDDRPTRYCNARRV